VITEGAGLHDGRLISWVKWCL